jgi:hypothetical protein
LISGTVTIQYGDDIVIDCCMDNWLQGGIRRYYCYGDNEMTDITYFTSNDRHGRYYIKIPIPDFLYEISIDSANFMIFMPEVGVYSSQDFILTINRLLYPLTEYYENTQGPGIVAPNHYIFNFDTTVTYPHDYVGWIKFDVKNLVNGWLNFDYDNYGFLVRMLNENSPTQQRIHTCQSLYRDKTKWPILKISAPTLPDTFITSSGIQTDVKTNNHLAPDRFSLYCYPNPFNSIIKIEYSIQEFGQVKTGIYDTSGKLVKELLSEYQPPGSYQIIWHGRDAQNREVSSGIYYLRFITKNNHRCRNILLLK